MYIVIIFFICFFISFLIFYKLFSKSNDKDKLINAKLIKDEETVINDDVEIINADIQKYDEELLNNLYEKAISRLVEREDLSLDNKDLIEDLNVEFNKFKEELYKKHKSKIYYKKNYINIMYNKIYNKSRNILLSNNLHNNHHTPKDYDNIFYNSEYIPSIKNYEQPKMNKQLKDKIIHLEGIITNIEKLQDHNKLEFKNNNYKIDYQNELNEKQLEAVQSIEKPLLIIAGAGTGKTKTLSYRVSYMLENNILAENILLLTFTRKASNEMLNRTKKLLQLNNINIQGGTFHSFGNFILRKYSKLLNISPNFTIIDTVDSQDVIDLIRRELKLEKINGKATPTKATIQKIISKSRNCKISIDDIIKKEYQGLEDYILYINTIYEHYILYNKEHSIYDYDDLLITLYDKLKENEQFRNILQDKYKYIMVDEFQDTNIIQKEIVDLIAEKYRNIMVVGDDSQSIYSFRGANYENILRFPETYNDCKIIKLEQNYRSKQDILNFSNNIVSNFNIGYKKNLYSNNKENGIPIIKKFYDQQKEADWIVDKIIDLHNRDISLNKIAVLYRAGYHANFLQASLMSKMINYIVYGGIKFAERKHVKDILAYLKIILNPLDMVSWNRILNRIEGIGNITASKITSNIEKNNGIIDFNLFKNKKYFNDLNTLKDVITKNMDDNISVVNKIENLKSYYAPILKENEEDYQVRLLDIDVLISLAYEYGNNIEKYISDFTLDPPSNSMQQNITPLIGETNEEVLTLSTVHSAKGLEWDYVFILNMLDGLFPNLKSLEDVETLDEERRLFYVACTRAKYGLYITMPSFVSSYDSVFEFPSRFIAEIDSKNYNYSIGENKIM